MLKFRHPNRMLIRSKIIDTMNPRNWYVPGICLLSVVCAYAQSPVRVRVESEPLRIHESETTSRSRQTITGPGGSRTISSTGVTREAQILNHHTRDTVEDIEIRGAQNPGITIERREYRLTPSPGIGQPGGITVIRSQQPRNPDGSYTHVEGGPGSIHTESHSSSSRTPNVQVRIGH